MDTEDIEKAVEQRRVWLQSQLEAAAARFDVDLVGEVVNTYDMRSAGARVREGDHDVWLRIVVEDPDYQPACRWDGNVEANSLRGVPKPLVLRWADWPNTASYLEGRWLHPFTARRLRARPVFATRSGQIALLFAIVRYLWVVGDGSDIDQLDGPLRAEAAEIMADLGVSEHDLCAGRSRRKTARR